MMRHKHTLVSLLLAVAMVVGTGAAFAVTAGADPVAVPADVEVWDGTTISESLSGEGTEANPYLIQSEADFVYFRNTVAPTATVDDHFLLTRDLYMATRSRKSATSAWFYAKADGTAQTEIASTADTACPNFAGHLDGGNHTVYNLSIKSQNSWNWRAAALFGTATGTLENLTFRGCTTYGENVHTAFLALTLTGATVRNCHVEDVSVSGVNMSVFANVANNVTIEGCSVSATLTRKGTNASVIGGLIGSLATAKSDTSVIRNCTVELTCDAKTTGGSMSSTFGGFIGKIISADNNSASSYATVENCTVKGSIVTTGGGKGTVTGGFVGSVGKDSKLTTFRNCVADMTLDVTGDNQTAVGGFIGRTDGWQYTGGSTILMESCMVRGTVTTSSAVVGGVVGNLTNAGLTLTGVYVDGAFESTADAATVGILSGTHAVLNNHLTKSSALYSPLAISLIGSDNADAVLNADQRVFVTGADFDAAQVAAYTAVLNEIANDAGAGAWYLSSAKGMPVPATALKVSGMRAVLTDGIALQFYVIGASGLSAADIVLMDEEGHTYTGETAVVGGKDAILFTVNDIQVVNLTETVSYRIAVRNIEGAEVLRISLLDYLAAIWQKDDTGSKEKALIETMVNFAYYYAVDSGVADPTVVTDFNRLAGASLTPSVDGAEDTISATGISGVTASLDFRGGVQLIIVSSGVVSAGAGYDVNQSGDQNVIGGLTLADMNRGIPLTIDGVSYNGFTIGTVLLAMINANQQADLARAAALYMNAAAEYAAQAQN